jgi:hypothetical protein
VNRKTRILKSFKNLFMATNNNRQSNGMGKAVAVTAGVVAATAAAYLMFGPNAKKNRKTVKGWAVKMKGEIIEKFENAKELSQSAYENAVDEVKNKYSKFKNVEKSELDAIVRDAKKHWKAIVRDSKSAAKTKRGNGRKKS